MDLTTLLPLEKPFAIYKSVKDDARRLGLRYGLGRRYRDRLMNILSPTTIDAAVKMLAWADGYIGKPHAEIGRSGAVCPFVPMSLEKDRFHMVFHEEVDGTDPLLMRDILLSHADSFKKRFPEDESKDDALASLTLVFPRLSPELGHQVDEVHTELKSFLMYRGFMLSQFHPLSTKKAARNASFEAYKSPFPCIVLRYMGLHDIVFMGHNKDAFAEYKRRFGKKYEAGRVGNEQGYADLYRAAEQRFLEG